MTIEHAYELEGLQRIGEIVANTLEYMKSRARPGMTTRELDDLGRIFLEGHGARSAPRITYGFPGTTCISVNNEIAHGIPSERKFQTGDLVNIDVSAELDGYFGDTGGSFVLGHGRPSLLRLCEATREARDAGIAASVAGRKVSDIGKAVEKIARKQGLGIIRNLGSHGVGRALHEEPTFIASYFDARDTRLLHKGLVITVEPFLSTGASSCDESDDGWTLFVKPQHRAAQFEHSIVVTEGKPIILTLPTRQFDVA